MPQTFPKWIFVLTGLGIISVAGGIVFFTHSSTLRTLEEIFGLNPLLGDAANATDLHFF